jgi:hypothetical protein
MVAWGRGMTGGGRCSVEVCSNVGEEERGTVSGAGCFEGRRVAFIGPGKGCRGGEGGATAGEVGWLQCRVNRLITTSSGVT